jgi:hypothetical protein
MAGISSTFVQPSWRSFKSTIAPAQTLSRSFFEYTEQSGYWWNVCTVEQFDEDVREIKAVVTAHKEARNKPDENAEQS